MELDEEALAALLAAGQKSGWEKVGVVVGVFSSFCTILFAIFGVYTYFNPRKQHPYLPLYAPRPPAAVRPPGVAARSSSAPTLGSVAVSAFSGSSIFKAFGPKQS